MPLQYQILEDQTSEKDYFQLLRAELVKQIRAQLGESEVLVDAFIRQQLSNKVPDDLSWMWSEAPTGAERKQKEISELQDKLSGLPIVVEGIQLPASDTELKGDYQRLFSIIPRLHFSRCNFYGESLLEEQETCITFSECTFHGDWKVTSSRACDSSQPLFDCCHFKKKVKLAEQERGFCPVSEYSAIFSSCHLAHAVVQDIVLDIPLIMNQSAAPTVIERLTLKNCRIQQKLA